VPDRNRDQDDPNGDLHRQPRERGRRVRLGGIVARSDHRDRDHDHQGRQPPEHEGCTLPDALLGGQHDEERHQRQRVERYGHADQNKV
jgi:hypothetical protein